LTLHRPRTQSVKSLTNLLGRIATPVFLLSAALVIWAIFRPTPPSLLFSHSDKIAHLAAFFVMALSGRFAFPRIPEPVFWLSFLLLAIGLECLQGALRPLRLFSLADALANALGTGLAAAAWRWPRSPLAHRE